MVGFIPDKKELPPGWYGSAGAISGAITRVTSQPLDVLKIRFQIHLDPIRDTPTSKYQGIVHASRRIFQEEGLFAFWKGHVPAQALSIIYGLVQFTTFEYLTKSVWHHLPSYLTTDLRPLTHFACGGLAGSLATLACQPCDVLRTRFVTQGQQKIYTSMIHASRCMLRQEGPQSFYKGLVPTLLQVAPQTALQFGVYTMLTGLWNRSLTPLAGKYDIGGFAESVRRKEFGRKIHQGCSLMLPRVGGVPSILPMLFSVNVFSHVYNVGGLKSLLCGSGSGFISKLIIYPLDMTKKRLQVQGFEKGWSNIGRTREYNGLIQCIKFVIREEGLVGLYKGLSPSLLKAIVVSAISFWSYEQTLNIMGKIK